MYSLRQAALWGCLLTACLTLHARAAQPPEGFVSLFNGKDLTGWKVNQGGKMSVWGAKDGILFVDGRGGGWLLTEKEYGDFEVRLEYKMPEHGNSGVGLRTPDKGDPAYVGMEIQLIDDGSWKGLQEWQHTGAIYNVVPPSSLPGKPAGQWNKIVITAKGRQVKVVLNDVKIVDANLDDHKKDFEKHPGLKREKGHLGLQSHDGRVEFRNLFVKEL
jgi:3-keto-disaccharide hydrolase